MIDFIFSNKSQREPTIERGFVILMDVSQDESPTWQQDETRTDTEEAT